MFPAIVAKTWCFFTILISFLRPFTGYPAYFLVSKNFEAPRTYACKASTEELLAKFIGVLDPATYMFIVFS
jgi:hypothetical protein